MYFGARKQAVKAEATLDFLGDMLRSV
jgi:hypothetical protein